MTSNVDRQNSKVKTISYGKHVYDSLDDAKHAYDITYNEYKDTIDELYSVYDKSEAALFEVAMLIESIRHKPIQYNSAIKCVKKNKEQFKSTEERKKNDKLKKHIASGAVVIATAASVGLIGYLKEQLDKEDDNNLIYIIVILIGAVITFIVRKIIDSCSQKKVAEEKRKVEAAIADIKSDISKYQQLSSITEKELGITLQYLNDNKHCYQSDYRTLTDESKQLLFSMVNAAETLSKLLAENAD